MKMLAFLLLSTGLFAQLQPLCMAPPGTRNVAILTACPPAAPALTGVALSTLPPLSLAIKLPDGTYLPVVIVPQTPAPVTPAIAKEDDDGSFSFAYATWPQVGIGYEVTVGDRWLSAVSLFTGSGIPCVPFWVSP